MSQDSEFLARLLRTGSRAYAAYAVNDVLASMPEAKADLGAEPLSVWQNWMAVRVEELAAAVAVEQPALFASQVQWGRAVLEARGVSVEHFRAALIGLKRVLADELPDRVQALAVQYLDQTLDAFDEQPVDIRNRVLPDTPHGHLTSTYLLALLEGDRRHASRIILDAAERPEHVPDIYLHVLVPAQAELGRMWMTGEINVAEEHFASHVTKMVMGQLLSRAELQPLNGKTVLAAAVAGNQHDIGLSAVADFFDMAGWRTIQLGADVPITDLVQAVECFDVDLVALSASLNVQFETVKSTIQAVRAGRRGGAIKILAGGLAFANSGDLAVDMGADGYASDPEAAVRLGGELVGIPPNHDAR